MSVTDLGPANSCNAAEVIVHGAPTGCDCGTHVLMWQRVDVDGNAVDDPKQMTLHCLTCHSHDHNACVECGACLPDWKPSFARWPGEDRRRIDARFCSNACRQRAYRARKASS